MSDSIGKHLWENTNIEEITKNKVGRPRRWKSPEHLWENVISYFKHCDELSIKSIEETDGPKGTFSKEVQHHVPYTWKGLFAFLSIPHLDDYKKRKEFSGILTHIGNIMFSQKFIGASAGIFNSSIISKELGLVDKKEVKQETTKLKIKGLDKLKDD